MSTKDCAKDCAIACFVLVPVPDLQEAKSFFVKELGFRVVSEGDTALHGCYVALAWGRAPGVSSIDTLPERFHPVSRPECSDEFLAHQILSKERIFRCELWQPLLMLQESSLCEHWALTFFNITTSALPDVVAGEVGPFTVQLATLDGSTCCMAVHSDGQSIADNLLFLPARSSRGVHLVLAKAGKLGPYDIPDTPFTALLNSSDFSVVQDRTLSEGHKGALVMDQISFHFTYFNPWEKFGSLQDRYDEHRKHSEEVLKKIPNDRDEVDVTYVDDSILPHIIKSLAGSREVIFTDKDYGRGINDLRYLVQIAAEPQPEVRFRIKFHFDMVEHADHVIVKHLLALRADPESRDFVPSLQVAKEVLESHISECLKTMFQITSVTAGSATIGGVAGNVNSANLLQSDPTSRCEDEFGPCFKGLDVTPEDLALTIRDDCFDSDGHKNTSFDGYHKVGPLHQKRTYFQPNFKDEGWYRFGLKVADQYPGDRWLRPFEDNHDLWYRCYHGTGKAECPAAAVVNIIATGFHPSDKGLLGPGCYCTPFLWYVTGPHGDDKIKYGARTEVAGQHYEYVLQVATDPGSIKEEDPPIQEGTVLREYYPADIIQYVVGEIEKWTVPASGIRPYGILVRRKVLSSAHSA